MTLTLTMSSESSEDLEPPDNLPEPNLPSNPLPPVDPGTDDAYADGTPEPLRVLEEILASVKKQGQIPSPAEDPDDPEF
jgi:hypothetical protein